jgi:predicted TIM-barrel fold metal-dependent hydrolase
MRTITLEEHFATPRFLDGPGRDLKEQAEKFNNARALKLIPQLCDLGDKRIAEMDAAGIDMQIVSLTAPGVEQLEAAEAISLAVETNDFVADAITKHPARFGGFAALPIGVPDTAAQELERRVRGQKFAGAIINATTAAATSTTSSSGRSWKVPNSSARRSTYIQRDHRNRS